MSHHVGYLVAALATGPAGAIFLWFSFLLRMLLEGLPEEAKAIFNVMFFSFLIIGIILIIVGCTFFIVGMVEYQNRYKK